MKVAYQPARPRCSAAKSANSAAGFCMIASPCRSTYEHVTYDAAAHRPHSSSPRSQPAS